jgi:hypothetical protein
MSQTRVALIVAGVAASLVLAACTGGSEESASSTASTSPAEVQSASPGEVVSATHPRSRCEENDDLTANVRLYNEMQALPIKDFALQDTGDADAYAVWLKQSGGKAFEADDNGEGNFGCASVPYAVKNGPDKTYYFYDGRVWSDHPGWWGHQEECDWCDNPKGYVDFSCSGPYRNGWQPCVDSALVGDVVARWDTTDVEAGSRKLKSHPPCDTRNAVIGCYLLIPEGKVDGLPYSDDFDFGFESYAWTAPMQVTLSTRFTASKGSYPLTNAAGDTKSVSQDVYLAWRVTNPKIGGGEWAQKASPQGQIVTTKASPIIGGYAQANQSGTTTIALRLVPAYFTNQQGDPLNCIAGATVTCTYVPSGETPKSVADFYTERPVITVNASLTLENVSRTSGPPRVKESPIVCRPNFPTVNKKNLIANCNADAEPGRSAYTYGATWQVSITN